MQRSPWSSGLHPKGYVNYQVFVCSWLISIDFLNIFKSYRPPVYQPSQSPVYSNAGISLVGLVVEAASNNTFDAAIRDLVLKPLGLEQTYSGIVPENSENMFIPAGSPDWDADIGIFAP